MTAPISHALQTLEQSCAACRNCGLVEERQRVVVGRGNPEARLMLIGEAPGAEEDASGLPFVGRSGQLLSGLIAEAGLDEEQDLYICNVIKCRPPGNRKPTAQEMKCRPKLEQRRVNPPLVLLAVPRHCKRCWGSAAASANAMSNGITRTSAPYRWVIPPVARFRSRGPRSPRDLTLQDLKEARRRRCGVVVTAVTAMPRLAEIPSDPRPAPWPRPRPAVTLPTTRYGTVIHRRQRTVMVGDVPIGSEHPVVVQSMINGHPRHRRVGGRHSPNSWMPAAKSCG